MPSIVALDIESTGIDSQKDAIIEIGAVRFDGARIEGEWHSLINPGRRIPPFITQLTGINDNMVRQAPSMRDVAESLAAFVGEAPILGQRIAFDLSFLRRHNLFRYNDSLDTYDIAAVMMPGAGRYNLGALGQQLNVAHPATHRALDDAKVTQAVYARLYERMLQMPIELLAEIARMAESQAWGGELAFRYALRERSAESPPAGSGSWGASGPIFTRPPRTAGTRSQGARGRSGEPEEPKPLDLEEATALLQPGGALANNFESFEHRSQQVEMLRAVGDALGQGHHLLVEAGTGTGKSMAYLLPAALFAKHNDTRVVISTNTINLQDQLIYKDIPDLQRALGEPVSAVVLKGRNNYLCPRRLMAMRRRGPESAEELRVLAKVLVWLESTQTGDRGELNLNGAGERAVWTRVSAADENCGGETCVVRMGGICPFHRAYQAAENADLVVVNHALLLADVATGSRVLPEYQYLVVDEAHHIESATTSALSFRLTQPEVERALKELGGSRSGQLGRLLVVSQQALQPSQRAALETLVEDATDRAFQFQNLLLRVFGAILRFVMEQREGLPEGSDYTHQERIIEGTRTLPAWLQVETAWEDAQLALQPLLGTIEQIQRGMKDLGAQGVEELEDLASNIGNSYRSLSELNKQLQALVFEPRADIVYWVEMNPQRQSVVLNAAPLHVGDLMEEHIWHKKTSVVMTSATLTAAGEFDYIKSRLHATEAEELALGSPFDYESAAMLYLVDDMPEPAERHAYQAHVERGLIELAKAANGRMLALFTSYEQLRRTSRAIAGPLRQAGIELYEQGEGASPHALLENFKSSQAGVLLGTRAFWEGVDIPGEALSVLAIVRLPFDVPSDPLVAARSETFESPFYEYQVPEAILRFRQGFGRLIRTQFDRGVVAIFDRRILTKQYGTLFIDSLPQCTLRKGSLAALPRAAAQWLGN
ncbi:MAG: 3'-5' exoribonuclease [Anaerolineales bacterium]|nr:3'-5' exoribonuclease [Anaerolineales bacterium]